MPRSYVRDEFYAAYIKWDHGTTTHFGPYDTIGTAKGVLSAELRYSRGVKSSGICRGNVTWTEVDVEAEALAAKEAKKQAAKDKRAAAKQEKLDRENAAVDELWKEIGVEFRE